MPSTHEKLDVNNRKPPTDGGSDYPAGCIVITAIDKQKKHSQINDTAEAEYLGKYVGNHRVMNEGS